MAETCAAEPDGPLSAEAPSPEPKPVRAVSTDEANWVVPERAEDEDHERFLEVFRSAIAAVEAAGVEYLLMGGIGSAAYGRPRWTHDVDLFVRPEDARRSLDALAGAGFETEQTFPDWLYKGFKNGFLVDVIFRSKGGIVVDDEMVARSRKIDVHGTPVRTIPPEDLIVIKAIVHDEPMPRHWFDALAVIACCQLEWDYLVKRARQSGARRVLSLLLYAQSIDLIVPARPVRQLFEEIYAA